jgi:hypothetical protein
MPDQYGVNRDEPVWAAPQLVGVDLAFRAAWERLIGGRMPGSDDNRACAVAIAIAIAIADR